MRWSQPKYCSECSEEIEGKIQYISNQRPIAIFCSRTCYDRFGAERRTKTISEYKKGYNDAVDSILDFIETAKIFYRQQTSRIEEVAVSAILRDLRTKYIRE